VIIIAPRLLCAGDGEKGSRNGQTPSAACRTSLALPAPQTRGEAFARSGVKIHSHT